MGTGNTFAQSTNFCGEGGSVSSVITPELFFSTPFVYPIQVDLVVSVQACLKPGRVYCPLEDLVISTSCYIQTAVDPSPDAASVIRLPGIQTEGITISPEEEVIATMGEVGSVYGVAYDQPRDDLYVSAYLKRFNLMGPGGSGAIYVIRNAYLGCVPGDGCYTTTASMDVAQWWSCYVFPTSGGMTFNKSTSLYDFRTGSVPVVSGTEDSYIKVT